jgi:hypothetical protein
MLARWTPVSCAIRSSGSPLSRIARRSTTVIGRPVAIV